MNANYPKGVAQGFMYSLLCLTVTFGCYYRFRNKRYNLTYTCNLNDNELIKYLSKCKLGQYSL